MLPKTRILQSAYVGLWLIRIWSALSGTGYIHPDEHMQNGEVTAGNILGLHAVTTWEWHPEFPLRSIIPTFMTTGLPLLGLRLLFGRSGVVGTTPHVCLSYTTFGISMLVKHPCVLNLISHPAPRRMALLLLASSYVTCTLQVRPFSNSLEAVLVSLCLVLLRRILGEWTRLKIVRKTEDRGFHLTWTFKRDLHLLAVLAVIGIFTRPTFVALSLPIAYQLLRVSYQVAGSPAQIVGLLLPPICSAAAVASVFIAADTYYFLGNFSKLVITPYNFIKYNLSAQNLADHGLHPNWLHVGVNLPMLLGPLFIRFTWYSVREYVKPSKCRLQKVHFETDIIRPTLIQIVILSLSALSLQPHQEPRFLTPLILPIIVLVATAEITRPRIFFWISWITFNVVLGLVFGIFHQGGVVPSLFSLHSTLETAAVGSSTHIIYWKTYMPPRHLLGASQQDIVSGKLLFEDLSGALEHALMAALSTPSFNSTYLVTPASMYLTLSRGISSCMTLKERISPHLDLDRVPESIQTGAHEALSLGIYAIEWDCIHGLATQVPL